MEVEKESATSLEKGEKLTRLPLSRVRNIMKLDPDVSMASQEAVFLIAKATVHFRFVNQVRSCLLYRPTPLFQELFLTALTKEAYTFTKQSKKKTMQKKDIGISSYPNGICILEYYKC